MEFEVDINSLETEVTRMQVELETLKLAYKSMYSSLEALDGMWSGDAHDAYIARYAEDMERILAMLSIVFEIVRSIEAAKVKYDKVDTTVCTNFNAIAI